MPIVFSEKSDENTYIGSEDIVLKTAKTIFRESGRVRYVYSELHTGLNKYSGKRYYRWQEVTNAFIGYNKNGTLVASDRRNIRHHTSVSHIWRILDKKLLLERDFIGRPLWLPYPSEFYAHVEDEFKDITFWDVFPVAKHYNASYEQLPKAFVGTFRSKSSREFVERVFGKRQYRKDLLKATAATNLNRLAICREFRGLVPTDWIISSLEPAVPNVYGNFSKGFKLRKVLQQIDPRSYKSLLGSIGNVHVYLLEDITRVSDNGNLPEGNRRFRTWDELHDAFVPRYTGYRSRPSFEDKPIKLTSVAKKIKGNAGPLEIVPAEHTSIMTEWGSAMHNCIAGYKVDASTGKGVYGGVYLDSKLIGNFEIRNNRLTQLLGPCNQRLSTVHRTAVEVWLKSANVTVDNTYWGAE